MLHSRSAILGTFHPLRQHSVHVSDHRKAGGWLFGCSTDERGEVTWPACKNLTNLLITQIVSIEIYLVDIWFSFAYPIHILDQTDDLMRTIKSGAWCTRKKLYLNALEVQHCIYYRIALTDVSADEMFLYPLFNTGMNYSFQIPAVTS